MPHNRFEFLKNTQQTGTIASWNEAKGFGFVQPDSGVKQVFIHVSELRNRKVPPQVGQKLSYRMSTDKQGRPCGVAVKLAGDKVPTPKRSTPGTGSHLLATGFLATALASHWAIGLPIAVFVYFFGLSALTYAVYAWDKHAAQNNQWRTPENTLHILALCGGWPGAAVAQQRLRHKSQKTEFRYVFWLTVLANTAFFVWLHTDDGLAYVSVWVEMFNSTVASWNL